MYILSDLKGQRLNHDHVVYEYMGAECSKLRDSPCMQSLTKPRAVAIASCYEIT